MNQYQEEDKNLAHARELQQKFEFYFMGMHMTAVCRREYNSSSRRVTSVKCIPIFYFMGVLSLIISRALSHIPVQ